METHIFHQEMYDFSICAPLVTANANSIFTFFCIMLFRSAGTSGLFLFDVRQHRSEEFSFHLSKIQAVFSRLLNNINYHGSILTKRRMERTYVLTLCMVDSIPELEKCYDLRNFETHLT